MAELRLPDRVRAALLNAENRVRGHRGSPVTTLDALSSGVIPKPRASPRIHNHEVRRLPKLNRELDNPSAERQNQAHPAFSGL